MAYFNDLIRLTVTAFLFVLLCCLVITHLYRRHLKSACPICLDHITNPILSNKSSSTVSSVSPTLKRHRSFQFARVSFSDELQRKHHFAELMTWINLLSSTLMVGVATWSRLAFFRIIPVRLHCQFTGHMLAILYILIRTSIYCVFVNRVDMAYSNTIYAYKKHHIQLCYVTIATMFVISVVWAPFAVRSPVESRPYTPSGNRVDSQSTRRMKSCGVRPSLQFTAFAVLFDVIFISIMVRMFVVPLRHLFARDRSESSRSSQSRSSNEASSGNSNSSNSNGSTTDVRRLSVSQVSELEMKLLPVKYTVVSSVSVLSTCLALLIVAASGWGLAVTIDNFVNSVCLLLMVQEFNAEYWLVCGPLLRSLHRLGLVNRSTHESLKEMTSHFYRRRSRVSVVSSGRRTMSVPRRTSMPVNAQPRTVDGPSPPPATPNVTTKVEA